MDRARRGAEQPSNSERELELKFSVSDIDAARELVAADVLAGFEAGPWSTVEMVDQYLDTSGGALARAGYGARLRHLRRRTLLTIKSARSAPAARQGRHQALHDRMELEARAGRGLDPGRWPESGARSLIEATTAGERLRTLFFIDQRREQRDLLRAGTVVATLSLDSATVRRFGKRLGSFATLEIEAVAPAARSSRAMLVTLAAAFDESSALQPEQLSKEQIARAMVERTVDARRSLRPPRQPGVQADDQLSEAGRKVLHMHLLRMLAADPGVRAGDDITPVHKMRVATRRMRAAWRVFNGAYRPRLQRRYVDELRSVAGALGAVRDIDVQLGRLNDYRARLEPAAGAALAPLADEWQRRRAGARVELLDLLGSAAYDRFIADYRSFVETPGAGALDPPGDRVRHVAAGRIWRAYERLRAHDATLAWADIEALHAVRIDGKRLRYTLEFWREILPPSADGLIADVTQLQDHLGLLNDAQIAADLTRTWLLGAAGGLLQAEREAAGAYLEASEAEVVRQRRTLRPIWRRLTGRAFRRRLALVIGAI